MKKINPRFVFRLFGIGLFLCMFHASQGQNTSTSEATTRYEKINLLFYGASSSQEVTVAIRDGNVYLSDDMILCSEKEFDKKKLEKGNIIVGNRWEDGKIPYKLSKTHPRYRDIVDAINHINTKTNICLTPYNDESDFVEFVFIEFDSEGEKESCYSYVGKQSGRQIINITNNCQSGLGSVVHEICHAAGMFHEHQRPNRDSFIELLEYNMKISPESDDFKNNFGIMGTAFGAYDYGSVMHYHEYASSKDVGNLITIRVKNPYNVTPTPKIGQQNGLSAGDIATLNSMYTTKNCERCPKPTDLAVLRVTSTSATLVWSSSFEKSYRLEYRIKRNNVAWSGIWLTEAGYTLTGLKPDSLYEFRVASICDYSETNFIFTDPKEFRTNAEPACPVPTNLTAANITATSATLSWGLVPNASSYRFEYRAKGTTNWIGQTITSNVTTLNNLTANQTYEFRVGSVCSISQSEFSIMKEFIASVDCGCAIPTNLRIEKNGIGEDILKWDRVPPGRLYFVQYKIKNSSWGIQAFPVLYDSEANLTPLSENPYFNEIEIRIFNSCDDECISLPSEVISHKFGNRDTPDPTCNGTSIKSVTYITNVSAMITWNLLPEAQSYKIEYRRPNQSSWTTYTTTTDTSTTLSSLSPNTTYEVRVITNCTGGSSSNPSPIATFTTTGGCADFQFDPDPIDVPVYYPCDTRPYATPVIGGTAPYKYKWSNGSTNTYIQNVPAGTYGVTVTDANGCSISKNVLVPVIEKPQLTVLNTEKANCNNRGGEAVAFVSRGTPPYSYLWSDGQNSSYLLDVSAGVYTVTVTDAIGCTAIQSVTIPIKTLDTPGTITISNVAATSATLRWNDTGAEQYRVEYRAGSQIGWLYYGDVTTPSVTMIGLVAGTAHQVRIIAYCGNTSSSPSPIARFTTATNTNPCIGFAFDTAPVTSPIYYPCDTRPYEAPVIGGTAPYKYKWSNGSTNNYIQNVPAGTYGVTVTDAKGCSISKNVIVPLIEKPVLTIGTIKAATCNKLDGEASISASKGTPPYNYEWSNWTYNAKLTGVSAGTYQVTVTDDKGCYTSITVNIPTAPLATPSGVSISNITTSSATVSWNNANAEQYKVEYRVGTQATWSLYSYASTPSIIMNGLVPGNTYSVRITALCGSTSSASSAIKSFTTLTTNKPPTVAITAPANNATYNAPATVNVTATASDPDGTISKVEFYLNNTLVSTDNAPSYNATLSNLAAGTYTLTAKAFDDMQASATSSVITIKVNTNGGGGSVTDNNVLVLNGTSDYKESPTFSSYQTIKSFTLETWVKFNNPGVGTNDFIAEVGNANYTKLWFWYNNDNTFGLPSKNIAIGYNGAQGGFNNGPDFMYDFSPQAGTWYHLAFSYNNSTRQITLYINGASRGSRTVTGNAPEININNLKLYLGKRIFGGVNSHFFDGQMDDFRMWNYARSASEITNNYKTELTGKESGLIAYYKFDETSAGMNKDCSANQLHLTAGSSRAPIISNVPSLVDVACGANFSGEESFRIIESDHNELNFEGITVYPNPTSGILNVSIINPISIPTEWIIQDVTGKILYIEKRGMDSKRKYDDFTIDISHLNGGLYFLSTIINEKRIIRKIILSQKN